MIPITPSGLGLKEIAGIYLYNMIGVSNEIIAARYVVTGILNYGYSLLIVSFVILAERALS